MKLLYNPDCSKCRTALAQFAESKVEITLHPYLQRTLSRAEILSLIHKLGSQAMQLVRIKEARYQENPFPIDDADTVATNLEKYPELIERPILIQGERAYIVRSPEALAEALKKSK